MSNTWEYEFSRILTKMLARKDSEFFREPVAWEELGLVDYPVVITKPMDFQTLKAKFESREYRRLEDAANDVRQIFINAITYNAPGSRVYSNAKALSDFFEQNWANVVKDDVDRPPTTDAMVEFAEKSHRLSPEDLGKMLKILDNNCPNCLIKKFDSNEVEVNVDLISGRAFREASNYVNECLPEMVTNKRTASIAASANVKAISSSNNR
eukprot:gene14014-18795_t